MATIKCKMCGGTMEILDNSTVAVCEYCGTRQTIPSISDDRKANLYDRANHFRRNNEFDKAQAIYEQILNEDPNDAESYWSLVLCKYGIEYVEDPSTHKRVPTVNRTQFTSVLEDANYKEAIRRSDDYRKSLYEEEATVIDDIQKGILRISAQEKPYDVFICYKETDDSGKRTRDSVIAQELYNELVKEGFKVFFSRITLEGKLGTAYEPYIFAALNSSKVMVVVGTKPEYFKAVWVKNEWSRFLDMMKKGEKKTLIPAYRDMDPYDLPEEFSFLQAQDMSKLGFMQDLVSGISKILNSAKTGKADSKNEKAVVNSVQNPLLKRVGLFIEEGDFDSATEYINRILDSDPENPEAYYLRFLCKKRLKDLSKYFDVESFSHDKDICYSYRFADEEYKAILDEQKKKIQANEEFTKRLLQAYDYAVSGGCFKDEIQDIEKKIQEINSQKQSLVKLNLEMDKIQQNLVKNKTELEKRTEEHQECAVRLSKCGVFAIKEKKELKERIEKLLREISTLESEMTNNSGKQKNIAAEINSLEDESVLTSKIDKLKAEKEEYVNKKIEAERELPHSGDIIKIKEEMMMMDYGILKKKLKDLKVVV